MQYEIFGAQNRDTVLLLHGGGLSWWNYRQVAQLLAPDYRVILPILDGHSGSDRDFTTIAQNAEHIRAFIREQLGGSVLLLGGVSLGGQIAVELLSQQPDVCRYALLESVLVQPSRLTHALIRPAFGSCYGLVKQKWFAKLQFWSLRIQKPLFTDYYRDTCGITKENMIAFLQENSLYACKASLADSAAIAHIFVGEKESAAMKRSAEKLQQMLPGSRMQVLPNMYHGQFSLNYPELFARTVREILEKGNEA